MYFDVMDYFKNSELEQICYSNHCEMEYSGSDIIIHSADLGSDVILVCQYNEDDDYFWFEVTMKFTDTVLSSDEYGDFHYISRNIADLTNVANYISEQTFYFYD